MGRGAGSTRLGIIPKINQFFSAPLIGVVGVESGQRVIVNILIFPAR